MIGYEIENGNQVFHVKNFEKYSCHNKKISNFVINESAHDYNRFYSNISTA